MMVTMAPKMLMIVTPLGCTMSKHAVSALIFGYKHEKRVWPEIQLLRIIIDVHLTMIWDTSKYQT